jgi:hypothetical protein
MRPDAQDLEIARMDSLRAAIEDVEQDLFDDDCFAEAAKELDRDRSV